MLRRLASETQLEFVKGKLTAVAFALRKEQRANARNVSFPNSLRRLIYLYQLPSSTEDFLHLDFNAKEAVQIKKPRRDVSTEKLKCVAGAGLK